jgi:hypothetical protein
MIKDDDDIQEYVCPWVGLTDEEITQIIEMGLGMRDSIKTALDKLKERNA